MTENQGEISKKYVTESGMAFTFMPGLGKREMEIPRPLVVEK